MPADRCLLWRKRARALPVWSPIIHWTSLPLPWTDTILTRRLRLYWPGCMSATRVNTDCEGLRGRRSFRSRCATGYRQYSSLELSPSHCSTCRVGLDNICCSGFSWNSLWNKTYGLVLSLQFLDSSYCVSNPAVSSLCDSLLFFSYSPFSSTFVSSYPFLLMNFPYNSWPPSKKSRYWLSSFSNISFSDMPLSLLSCFSNSLTYLPDIIFLGRSLSYWSSPTNGRYILIT